MKAYSNHLKQKRIRALQIFPQGSLPKLFHIKFFESILPQFRSHQVYKDHIYAGTLQTLGLNMLFY